MSEYHGGPNPPQQPQQRPAGNQQFDPQHPEKGWHPAAPYQPKKKHTVRNILLGAGAVLVVILGAAGVGGAGDDKTAGSAAVPTPAVTSVDNGPTPDPITTPTNKPSAPAATAPKPTVAPKATQPTKTAPAMTASQEQAIGTAQDYLGYQSFSRKGLIGQLKFEGFSAKDATFAVDYLKVNWSLQAVGVAKGYLENQHFSRSGLIDQLEYEGFTHKQAVYGVTKAGL